MAQYIYTMNQVSKMVPPKRFILKNISLSFFPGAKIGVLGLNGAGKSTLLRIMAGVDTAFDGEARPQAGIKVGYLAQEPELDPKKNVREVIEEALTNITEAEQKLEKVYAAYAEPDADFDKLAKEQAALENIIQAADGHNIKNKLEQAADALRLPEWDDKIEYLSGGERRRVALCRLLLSHPDMLLLDEPTNHLDAESVAWLEHYLMEYQGTVVAITHDRYFLDNATDWILELDRGEGIPYKGNYSAWLEQKKQRLEQEKKKQESRQKIIKHELEWVRSNPKGRRAKNKDRLSCFENLISQEFQERNETNEIYIPPGPRLGSKVLEVKNLSKSFGDKLLIQNLSFTIPKGAIVGLIGGNGAGKSTLLRMIRGDEKPDAGSIDLGETVVISYVEQLRHHLDDTQTVWEAISDKQDILNINGYEIPSRGYISRFNFKGSDQQKRLSELSGGERGRLQLAETLKKGGNFLLLDEPSNDLDIETLRALEEALLVFPGCAMIISHDRWFLDRVCTHILAYEGDSTIQFFEGGYTEYEQYRKEQLNESLLMPKRVRYKTIK